MLLPVADGKATGSFYFNFSSEVLTRTSSQTCGRWYLPTFLLRDGSLTLMYRASFIVLIWFKSSLPIILKLLMVTLWPLMLLWSYMGEGGFRCSLNLSPKVLGLIYICTNQEGQQHHQTEVGRRPRTEPENNINHKKYHKSSGVLHYQHILQLPREVLWAGGRCCYGVSLKLHSSQHIYGKLWGRGSQISTPTTCPVEEICGWHIHHLAVIPEGGVPGIPQFHWSAYTIHTWKTERRWSHALLGYTGDTWKGRKPQYIGV